MKRTVEIIDHVKTITEDDIEGKRGRGRPVSYTHLDVYKRQDLLCRPFYINVQKIIAFFF